MTRIWTRAEINLAQNIRWVLEEKSAFVSEIFYSGDIPLHNLRKVYPEDSLPFLQALTKKLARLIKKQGFDATHTVIVSLANKISEENQGDRWQDPAALASTFNAVVDKLPEGQRKLNIKIKEAPVVPGKDKGMD